MKLNRLSSVILSVALISLSLSVFFGAKTLQASFGTSPPWVRNEHMLPGTTYEQVINLSRSDTSKAMQVDVRLNGDEQLIDWIEIPNLDNLILRPGERSIAMKVIVDVPEKAALRNYISYIRVSLVPIKDVLGQGGEVAITLGANIQVDITVTGEKVTKYRIESINTNAIHENEPLIITTKLTNLGNTEITKINGTIDIYDNQQKELIESLEFEPFPDHPVSPEVTAIRKMAYMDLGLEPGQYWLNIKINEGNKVSYENQLFQEIKEKAVPIVTPEDAEATKPLLPGSAKTETEEEKTETDIPVIQVNVPEYKPAASDESNNLFLIFGLAGLGFGMIAIIAVIVVLVFMLKNQRNAPQQAANMPYPMPSQAPQNLPPQAPQNLPQPPVEKPMEANPQESVKIQTDGENQTQ